MDLPDAIGFILSFPGAEETTPFGPEVLVYKVAGKMFALTVPDDFPARLNLKCDPERAVDLRDILSDGRGVPRDIAAARGAYERGCALGDPMACDGADMTE